MSSEKIPVQTRIDSKVFQNTLFALLDETFENHHGIYLDRDTGLFRTLSTITAAQASVPVGGRCASLAAQVTHVIFYLEVLERHIVHHDAGSVDWGEIWRTVEKVTPDEWEALKAKLDDAYRRVDKMLREVQAWDEDSIGGALAIVVHTAYHLGEIRQAACTLK